MSTLLASLATAVCRAELMAALLPPGLQHLAPSHCQPPGPEARGACAAPAAARAGQAGAAPDRAATLCVSTAHLLVPPLVAPILRLALACTCSLKPCAGLAPGLATLKDLTDWPADVAAAVSLAGRWAGCLSSRPARVSHTSDASASAHLQSRRKRSPSPPSKEQLHRACTVRELPEILEL